MDKNKFNEIVEEYMMFDKRTLAELLAMRDMKNNKEDGVFNISSIGKDVKFITKRYCVGMNDYCYNGDCNGCIFSQVLHEQIKRGNTYVLGKDCGVSVSVSGVTSPDFTITSTMKQ